MVVGAFREHRKITCFLFLLNAVMLYLRCIGNVCVTHTSKVVHDIEKKHTRGFSFLFNVFSNLFAFVLIINLMSKAFLINCFCIAGSKLF